MWGFLSCIEEGSDDLVGLSNVDGMDTDSLIVFNKAFEGFTAVIRTL
jgi:hypothetical protein